MLDFAFTPAQRDFRLQVRAELNAPDVRGQLHRWQADGGREPDARPLYRVLGRRGLLAVNWPPEYGGRGLGVIEATIVAEELVRAGIPDTLHVNTIQIVGLFLLLAGTEEQKRRHLPSFAAGERFASVLYTEPDAASDLAALSTTATRATGDGEGGYRLDGVKVFSLKSDVTDLGLCAARTGDSADRYQGISLFLVDLHAPGVHRAVIPSIADEQFHRVELENVLVGADCLLGPAGQGWPLLTQALAIERTGLDYSLKAERWFGAVLCLAPEPDRHEEIGRYGAQVRASRLLAWQVLAGLADSGDDGVDETLAAAAKFYAGELAAQVADWAARTVPLHRIAPAEPAARILEAAYREAPGLTLSAGTSEVMLQIIASASGADQDMPAGHDTPQDPLQDQRDRVGAR